MTGSRSAMRSPRKPKRYEPPHSAYLLMLQRSEARLVPEPRSTPPSSAAPHDPPLVVSLRALLSSRGLSPASCRLILNGVDAEGLVIVEVESEGRSLSLRLRPGGYEVVQAVEASKPAP
jgi:hypothetical protein